MTEIRSIDHPALVTIKNAWFYVLGTTADFILDYPSYDPNYDPSTRPVPFRAGLMVVTPQDGFLYLSAFEERVFAIGDLGPLIDEYGLDRTRPQFLVDFDNATFTSAFFDQALEGEVGEGWSSSYSDPIAASPPHVQSIWPPFDE